MMKKGLLSASVKLQTHCRSLVSSDAKQTRCPRLFIVGRVVRRCREKAFDQHLRELRRCNGNEDRDDDNPHVRKMYSRDSLDAGLLSVSNTCSVTCIFYFVAVSNVKI